MGLPIMAVSHLQWLFPPKGDVAIEVEQIHVIPLRQRFVPSHTTCLNTKELAYVFLRTIPGNFSCRHLRPLLIHCFNLKPLAARFRTIDFSKASMSDVETQ